MKASECAIISRALLQIPYKCTICVVKVEIFSTFRGILCITSPKHKCNNLLPLRSFYTSVFTRCRTEEINTCRCVHSIKGGPNVVGLAKSCRPAAPFSLYKGVHGLSDRKNQHVLLCSFNTRGPKCCRASHELSTGRPLWVLAGQYGY